MPTILACVDESAYSHAVCDFAALFADRLDADVVVLAVQEPRSASGMAERSASVAVGRLSDHGFDRVSIKVRAGSFIDILDAEAPAAELIVMGKRGVDRTSVPTHLGAHVEPALRTLPRPVCLVSQLFLPISRALILMDSDPSHTRSMEFATTSPLLSPFKLEFVLMDDGRHVAGEKLSAARERLAAGRGAAFSIPAENPNKAVNDYEGEVDLMVMSREMLFGSAGVHLEPGDEKSFWRRRTPILIC